MFSKFVVIILSKKSRMNRPGNHMVAVSKIKESDDIAFISNDSNPLTYESIMSVGKSKPFNNRKLFKQKTLLPHNEASKEKIEKIIKQYSTTETPTVLDGHNNLIQWYRRVSNN